ncbi:MAG: LacI family DNA-binding transcriptional regulator [Lentisphaeria bacterium]|nr:LacI family DNA-binding transcriptional regulator [Lentisphaeria bacterium]
MATLKDIADRAGVNIATVSRFFNNRNLVKASTADKIDAIVKEVGYRQRARRQGPRTPDRIGIRHFRVMIVLNSISSIEQYFHWGSTTRFISAVFEELQKLDISMEFCIIGEDGTIPERLNPDYCDGAIICSEPDDPDVRARLHQRLQDISTVNTFLNPRSGDNDFDVVKFDSGEISRQSMRFFFESGVKEVAVFPEYKDRFTRKELVDSLKVESERIGIHCRDLAGIVPVTLPMNEYYRKLTNEFLRLKTVTGMMFVTSADMLGVMNELRARGIDITSYEFIAAFSCAHTLRYFEKVPPFIDIKHQQLGIMTATRLLDRMHSFNRLPRTDIVIAPELILLDD